MFIRKLLAAITLCCVMSVVSHATDWKKFEQEINALKAKLEKQGLPADYLVAGKQVSSQPETGINAHELSDAAVAGLKKAGIKHVRQTIYWQNLEKTEKPGVYSRSALAKLDKLVKKYTDNGLEPLMVVHGACPGVSFKTRQESYKRFAALMSMLAKRYPQVKYWELWNEMDVAFTPLFGAFDNVPMLERGKMYAEMLKLAYPAIKQANPDAVVVIGGLTDWQDFPEGVYQGGGKNFFDIMNIHTYGVPLFWGFIERGHKLRMVMNKHKDNRKPMWNTEYGVSAEAVVKAWGIPAKDAPKYYDDQQSAMLKQCIVFNNRAGLYQRHYIYAYKAEDESSGEARTNLQNSLPPGTSVNDYSYGLVRCNDQFRPAMEMLEKMAQKKNSDDTSDEVTLNPMPQRRLRVENGMLFRGNRPFFPLGFVFGADDDGLKEAISIGMNSVHQEYSLVDIFPDSPDKISPEGLKKVHDLHNCAERNEIVIFPLLTGHYIPGWLGDTAGPNPKDVEGKDIGLWFRHSIHNPVFRSALEKFWTVIAKEVGEDDNVGAFVNWNEPGYGLDASPDGLAAFRRDMAKKYKTISAFNGEMGTKFASFAAIMPPKFAAENHRFWYHWVEYNQQAFADFFKWERDVFKKNAPDANMTSKHPVAMLTGDSVYLNDIVLQDASQDIYGCDGYNGSLFHYRDIMEVSRSLNRKGPVITYETHPQKAIPPLKPEHAALQLFVQVLGGCRGIFFFAAGKIQDFGFFDDTSCPPAVRARLKELFTLINKNQDVFAQPRHKAEIAVLISSSSTIQYQGAPDDSLKDEYTRRLSQTFDLVRNQHFAVDFVSNRQLAERLKNYRLLVVPSLSILSRSELEQVAEFHRKGGKILAFGHSFERDEYFKPIDIPSFLGLKSRTAAPWKRGQMRIVEVAPELYPSFMTELVVQAPEMVNPAPMKELIPGYIPPVALEQNIWLAANQDAYPSIIQSTDKQVVYCAFDSIYSEGLSHLIGGIIRNELGIEPEISAIRAGQQLEALELMTALSGSDRTTVLMLANSGPNAGCWKLELPQKLNGWLKNVADGSKVRLENGRANVAMPGYGYSTWTINKQ